MRVSLIALRKEGALIPKWQNAFRREIVGELDLRERKDDVLNRASRVAVLHEIGTGSVIKNVYPLYDAQLVFVSKGLLILSGIERVPHDIDPDRSYDYAQTWRLEIVRD